MAAPLNFALLLDEAATPPLRTVIGALLAKAVSAHVAIAHVRLGHVDLSDVELQRVRCRLLLGHLDVESLSGLGGAGPRLGSTARFLDSGRLEIRAAGLLRWKPDFSVFELPPPHGSIALVGAHYFGDPDVRGGPALTCVVRGPAAVTRVRRRFDELWLAARDVNDVVRAELRALGA